MSSATNNSQFTIMKHDPVKWDKPTMWYDLERMDHRDYWWDIWTHNGTYVARKCCIIEGYLEHLLPIRPDGTSNWILEEWLPIIHGPAAP